MKKMLMTALMVSIGGLAYGQNSQDEKQSQGQQQQMQCKLFSVDQQSKKLVVIEGNFSQSGSRGREGNQNQQQQNRNRPRTIQVNENTRIHWQGDQEKTLTLADLQGMNQRQIEVPMQISYERQPGNENGPLQAKEIILQRNDNADDNKNERGRNRKS